MCLADSSSATSSVWRNYLVVALLRWRSLESCTPTQMMIEWHLQLRATFVSTRTTTASLLVSQVLAATTVTQSSEEACRFASFVVCFDFLLGFLNLSDENYPRINLACCTVQEPLLIAAPQSLSRVVESEACPVGREFPPSCFEFVDQSRLITVI